MKALLDTHVLLWYRIGDSRLPVRWRQVLDERNHELFFSAASVTEISIKFSSGKLILPEPPPSLVPYMLNDLSIQALPVTIQHALTVSLLPPHHSDPFDRLLVAQAQFESLPLITGDARLSQYNLQILW
jgi:PIN domain nuclease of toxin-antitoxin system